MTNQRKIKFTAMACRWFDKINNKAYHSVRIVRHKDGKVIAAPFQYGYDDYFRQTALEIMAKNKWLPVKYRGKDKQLAYEEENNYPIYWVVSDGLKRDCVANGKL